MTEPQISMLIALPVYSVADKWECLQEAFLALYQVQTAEFDDLLTEKIIRTLGADLQLGKGDDVHIRVMVNGGVAILTGHVGGSINKARAEAIANGTPGVSAVANHLLVDYELMINFKGRKI